MKERREEDLSRRRIRSSERRGGEGEEGRSLILSQPPVPGQGAGSIAGGLETKCSAPHSTPRDSGNHQ
ncbi:hypothetical protein D4764_01G0000190 [Takifugu flavidus]|uniref:Uncharacterized protein n=1 Tax=Takifugu flavidus TaxID=433684 RepID=A0A5C6PKC8_9TELE|nr:hypothetical protein D4764_01G0000190 [Takifugu flavidus]